jgi:hypothetical protein
MQEEINQRLNKVRQIIKDFDEFKIEYSQAKNKFNEGNRLLDGCLEMINKNNFRIDEISL